MSDFVTIVIDDTRLQEGLRRLERSATDLTPAMRKITQTLLAETEQNFAEQGRPRWAPLSTATEHQRLGGAKAYTKDGKLRASAQRQLDAGFLILQQSGQLAASVTGDYSATHSMVGSNKVYAAIQQFGGQAGRGRQVEIPARPYLPMTADDELQPDARESVLDTVMRHLQGVAGI